MCIHMYTIHIHGEKFCEITDQTENSGYYGEKSDTVG